MVHSSDSPARGFRACLPLSVSEEGESSGHCDCCGSVTRSVRGYIDDGEATVSAYWMRWTDGHIGDDAALDLCIGAWGDETTPADRVFVSLIYRKDEDGNGSVMVVDLKEPTTHRKALADVALRRDEVIGTPMALQVFALVDAILLQDRRINPPLD